MDVSTPLKLQTTFMLDQVNSSTKTYLCKIRAMFSKAPGQLEKFLLFFFFFFRGLTGMQKKKNNNNNNKIISGFLFSSYRQTASAAPLLLTMDSYERLMRDAWNATERVKLLFILFIPFVPIIIIFFFDSQFFIFLFCV